MAFAICGCISPSVRLVIEIAKRDAVDDIERIEPVAARLRHLLAFGVAHQTRDVNLTERHLDR